MKYSKLKSKITPGSIVLFSKDSKWINVGIVVNCDYDVVIIMIYNNTTVLTVPISEACYVGKYGVAIKILESPGIESMGCAIDNFILNINDIKSSEELTFSFLKEFGIIDDVFGEHITPGYFAKTFPGKKYSVPVFVNIDIK